MARKTLLTEAQVRQFMTLAHVPAIGSNRLQEMGYGMTEEDPIEDEEGPDDPSMDADAAFPPEDEAAPEMDAAPEDDMGDMGDVEMGDSVPVDKEDKFSDLVQQLADLVGIEVDLTTGDDLGAEMAPEDGLEVDTDDDLDMPPEDAAMAPDDLGMDSEEEEEDIMPMQERTQDALVKEVARRVAKRISNSQKKDVMVDQIAERILKRLTK